MSFALSSYSLPTLEDYDTAVAHWHATKPIRGYTSSDWRPLYNHKWATQRRTRSRWIKLDTHTGEVLCKYHYTEVMTCRPDGAVGIQPYPSISTGAFIDGLKPSGFGWTSMTHGLGCVVTTLPPEADGDRWDNWRNAHSWLLPTSRKSWFVKDAEGIWHPEDVGALLPVRATRLDKAETRKALAEHPYAQFRQWMTTAYGLTPKPTGATNRWGYGWSGVQLDIPDRERVAWLDEGPAAWAAWFTSHERVPALATLMEAIRIAVYKHEGCCTQDVLVPYPITYTQMRAIHATGRKWGRRGL